MGRRDVVQALTAGALAILLLTPAAASAQDVTEPALKAAYIYNFAKFTEWPADAIAPGAPFVFCVVGDAAIGEALVRTVKGLTLANHNIIVSYHPPDARPPEGCHIAYVSGTTSTQTAKVLAGLRDTPVLTISDLAGFTQMGGIAKFFFEHGRLRFDIQLAAAKRVRLNISSKLLTLARTTK